MSAKVDAVGNSSCKILQKQFGSITTSHKLENTMKITIKMQ